MPRAVQFTEFGSVDVLEIVEVPSVQSASGKVRVTVQAVGLNCTL
jgi:NADPH:quinone reductase-like Zn-dependent oxidoreductase